jgi:hypothetical protein
MKTTRDSVNLADLHPKLQAVLPIIDDWCRANLNYELHITSACDGSHSSTYSNHYSGCAIDMRTWTTPTSKRQIAPSKRHTLASDLERHLGEHFQVLNEATHFHIAFRPSRPATWANLVRSRA